MAETLPLPFPDSRIVLDAVELARSVSSPMLFNHVMRSANFAALFATAAGKKVDQEVVALSAILHDLGLTDHACGNERFEIRGAHAARSFANEHGVDEAKSWLIWDTIALHTHDLNLHKQDEAWAVQMGILADVLGAGLEMLGSTEVHAVVTRFPRLDFKRCFMDVLEDEERKGAGFPPFHPSAMIAYHRDGSIDVPDARILIGQAPFAE